MNLMLRMQGGWVNELDLHPLMRKMDAKAFLKVFEATKDGVYGLFLKATKDESRTEDLVQECYLRLWERRDEARDPESYVFGIAYLILKEYHRARIREALSRSETMPELEAPDSPVEIFQYKETRERFRKMLESLSPARRAAFTSIKIEERSYKESAELLGVPVSTLEKQVSGTIRLLKKVFRS